MLFRISMWMFNWNAEPESEGGSVVFTFCKVVHFVKYKDMTIIKFGLAHGYTPARKYIDAI